MADPFLPHHTTVVFEDAETLVDAAADMILSLLHGAICLRGTAHLALSGGSTPGPVYKRMAEPAVSEGLDWTAVQVWWADERCVPPLDAGSNYRLAKETLLDQVSIPPENVHRMKGEQDPADAAADYADQLADAAADGDLWPRLDAAVMGLGGDGHTASLFPGDVTTAELTRPVIAATADYDGRPAHRISLAPPVLNAARTLLFLVTGESKAAAVRDTLHPQADPADFPVRRLHPADGQIVWLLDRPAASLLPDS